MIIYAQDSIATPTCTCSCLDRRIEMIEKIMMKWTEISKTMESTVELADFAVSSCS